MPRTVDSWSRFTGTRPSRPTAPRNMLLPPLRGDINLKRLKWLAILAPAGMIGVLEYARYALHPVLQSWQGRLLMNGVMLMGALFFYGAVFTVITHMQERLESKNRQLLALRRAGLDIASDLSLDKLLQKVVDQARNLIGTRYGALSLVDGDNAVHSFVTSGIGDVERHRIGSPPQGSGLLGVVLREGQRLRLADIGRDARACGFPAHHPKMRSLLAVPVVCAGPFKGNLYLSEKVEGGDFTEEEEEALARFASLAAIAIDNAHLHSQVKNLAVTEERLRIAHEMHDGQAQVLAYVNTKTQAVRELLRAGRTEEASKQLDELAKAAREVYTDVREGILGLRAAVDSRHGFAAGLRNHIEQWQDRCGIRAELVVAKEPDLRPEVELQLVRIVQEALTNVRKHSGSDCVRVEIAAAGEGVRIAIEDFGVGFETEAPCHGGRPCFGLATMRERAEAIDADFMLHSQLRAGTRIEVIYPREITRSNGVPANHEPSHSRHSHSHHSLLRAQG